MNSGGQTEMVQKGYSKAEVLSDPYWAAIQVVVTQAAER